MTTHQDPLVWHYTSLNTLALILENHRFHAAEASFQNDPYEAVHAADTVRKVFEQKTQENPDERWEDLHKWWDSAAGSGTSDGHSVPRDARVLLGSARFLLCASTRDNFHMWRTYGSVSDVPCAIGLDRHTIFSVIQARPRTSGETLSGLVTSYMPHAGWTPVRYDSSKLVADELDKLYNLFKGPEYVSEYDDGSAHAEDVQYAMYEAWVQTRLAKDESYSLEEESRLAFENVNPLDVRFKPSGSGPRPYVEVGVLDGQRKISKLPVKEVMLGPTAPSESKRHAEWLLTVCGYEEVAVTETTHKFRNV